MSDRVRANIFRFCNILPSKQIEAFAKRKLTGVKFLPGFEKAKTWYEAERFVELTFDGDPEPDDQQKIGSTCGACGACCRNIPSHQIGIYMSHSEYVAAWKKRPGMKILQGEIVSDRVWFGVVDVDQNGDCVMLGPDGCTLGDEKPLWCKIYHCEKFQGKPYQFEEDRK